MTQYNMLDAKNNLSKICKLVASKEEDYIVIANNGKPLVKVVPFKENNKRRKKGILEGIYKYDERFDDIDKEIADMFYGE